MNLFFCANSKLFRSIVLTFCCGCLEDKNFFYSIDPTPGLISRPSYYVYAYQNLFQRVSSFSICFSYLCSYLFVCIWVCVDVCVYMCVSTDGSGSMCMYHRMSWSVLMSVCLSVYLCVCESVSVCLCLSVCFSVNFYVPECSWIRTPNIL